MLPDPAALRVLQVLPALETGGVERGTVEIAAAIAGAGGAALVASAGGRMVPEIVDAGGRHVTLPLASKNPWRIWRNAAPLATLIRAQRVRIVHARSRAPAWSALLAARRTGALFVTTYHGVYAENFPGKRRYNAVMAKGARVIAISRHVARQVEARHGVPRERIRVIPRGVDAAVFDPAAVAEERVRGLTAAWALPPGPVVMLPGRVTAWKGGMLLVEALARMARRDVIGVLLGPSEDKAGFVARLRQHAAAFGVADRLRLLPRCDDMPAALLAADCVVNASLEPEPFGRTVIEAQAMARPVVVADHGGPAETVEDGVTGWRVLPGDAAALAAALDHVLALSEAERAAIGARARETVTIRYTLTAMQQATLAVYAELLSGS